MSMRITDTFKARKPRSTREEHKASKQNDIRITSFHEKIGDESKVKVDAIEQTTNEDIKILRNFDLESEYGPCVGITRLERWERAEKFGLNPSLKVKELIVNHSSDPIYTESVWNDYNL